MKKKIDWYGIALAVISVLIIVVALSLIFCLHWLVYLVVGYKALCIVIFCTVVVMYVVLVSRAAIALLKRWCK